MKSLLLDIQDKNKKELWVSLLSLFEIKIYTTPEKNLSIYDFILTDKEDYLTKNFNFLIIESDKNFDKPNISSFNKYTSQDTLYSLFEDLTGDWYLLDYDSISLNLDIPYFIEIKDKKIAVDVSRYKDTSNKLIKTNDKIKALSIGTEAFSHKVESIGFTTESLLLADKIIKESIDSLNSNFLKEVVNDLIENKNYISEFVLKSYIGTSIAKTCGFKEKDISSLIKAFFLADSMNPNNKSHPIDTSNQIIEDRQASTIILQHHERPLGKGFPNKLQSHQIGELSKIYILSECFFILLKKYNFDKSMKKKIVYILDDKFSDRYFTKYIHSLKYLFYKKQK
jgi:hypothetical protein